MLPKARTRPGIGPANRAVLGPHAPRDALRGRRQVILPRHCVGPLKHRLRLLRPPPRRLESYRTEETLNLFTARRSDRIKPDQTYESTVGKVRFSNLLIAPARVRWFDKHLEANGVGTPFVRGRQRRVRCRGTPRQLARDPNCRPCGRVLHEGSCNMRANYRTSLSKPRNSSCKDCMAMSLFCVAGKFVLVDPP